MYHDKCKVQGAKCNNLHLALFVLDPALRNANKKIQLNDTKNDTMKI